MRLPVFFEAPATPLRTKHIEVTESTTPRELTLRTMFAAKKYTVPGGLLLIIHQLCGALVPVIMGVAIDRAISPNDAGQLVLWVAVLAVDFALVSFTFRFGSRIGFLGMQSIQHQVRTRITDRILDARGLGGPRRQPGMLLSIATSDARQLAMAVAIVVYPLGEFAAVVFSALILLFISWPLGLAILVAAPLMLWVMDVQVRRCADEACRNSRWQGRRQELQRTSWVASGSSRDWARNTRRDAGTWMPANARCRARSRPMSRVRDTWVDGDRLRTVHRRSRDRCRIDGGRR